MKTMKYRYLTMFGHMCTDINQGALPAILPFLIAANGLSYATAAGLVFATNLVSSIVQPLFGYLGDKVSKPWFMILGIMLAGCGMSAVGLMNNYWAIFLAAMVSGVGIAIFHPEGGRIANAVSGTKKGTGMSIFSVGGNMGIALGPIVVGAALAGLGLRGTFVLIVPAIAVSVTILLSLKNLKRIEFEARHKAVSGSGITAKRDDWISFAKLTALIFFRSAVGYGLTTFIPLYWVSIFAQTTVAGSTALSIYSISAAVATLLGGRLGDRYGFNNIIRAGSITLVPLLIILAITKNPIFAGFLLIPISLAHNVSFSIIVVLGQTFLPNRVGLASGITMGLGISMGGIAAPLLGLIGDRLGLNSVILAISAAALLAVTLAFFVPKPKPDAAE